MKQKVYVIIPYYKNLPPAPGQSILYTFRINDSMSCISECDLEWGQPRIAIPIEEQSEFYSYHYFTSYEDAINYVKMIKELNR